MRTTRLRCRVPLAALAAAGLVTVALPLLGWPNGSAMVGALTRTAAAAPQPAANPAVSCSDTTIYNVNQMGDLYALNYAVSPPHTITFRFVTHSDDDGISFTTQCGNQVEFSPLKSNGHAATASVIFLGSAMTNPASVPVTFVRNS